MPRALLALLALLVLLLAAGHASAFVLETREPFATTRGGLVTWKTSVPIETNSLIVNATTVQIGEARLDFDPTTSVTATISHWAIDKRSFVVTSATAGVVTFRMSNPGHNWTFVDASAATILCQAGNATCTWTSGSGTSWTFTVRQDLAGSGPAGAAPPAPAPPAPAGGGGGGGSIAPPVEAPLIELPALVSPLRLFPVFGFTHYAALATGLAFLSGASKITRGIVPKVGPFLYKYLPPWLNVFMGVMVLVLLYFSASSAFAAS